MQFKVTTFYNNNSLIDILMTETAQLGAEYYRSNQRLLNEVPINEELDNYDTRNLQDDSGSTDQSNITAFNYAFKDITEIGMLKDWVNSVLFRSIYSTPKNSFFRQNFLIGDPMLHLLIRIQKTNDNDDHNTNKVIPKYLTYLTTGLFDSLGNEAYKEDITLSSGTTVQYTEEGKGNTISGIGGYYVDYPRDYDEASKLDYINEPNLIQPTWVNILYSYFYVNANTGLTGINMMYLVRTLSGELKTYSKSMLTKDFYSSRTDRFRAFLEVSFIMITCLFAYKLVKNIFFKYLNIIRPRYEAQSESVKKSR